MRILIASKFWYPRGGLERVMFDELSLLEAAGHEVVAFSTRHPLNVDSPFSAHFAPYIELGADASPSTGDKVTAAVRMFSNREAARCFRALISDTRPDVIHIHGIHRQISPSILAVARAAGVPVVQTSHDYHHVCPADVLLKSGVERCSPRACGTYSYLPAVLNRCVRGSLSASALSAAETSFQRIRGAYDGVSCFICPSNFMARQLTDGGWKVPTTVLRNPVAAAQESRKDTGSYFLYAGRLSPEKGVETLLEAAAAAGIKLILAGTGPSERQLRADHPDADFRGFVDSATVSDLLRGARAAVVPSIWFENAPLSVLEPMAEGVPVIASNIGGIPEMIASGDDGLLVPPADPAALAEAMRSLADAPDAARDMGERARRRVLRDNDPGEHVKALLGIYDQVTGLGGRQ